jgi:hypothetical protein
MIAVHGESGLVERTWPYWGDIPWSDFCTIPIAAVRYTTVLISP